MLEAIWSYFPDVIIWVLGVVGLLSLFAGIVIYCTTMNEKEKHFSVVLFSISSIFLVNVVLYYVFLFCTEWNSWACFGIAFVVNGILVKNRNKSIIGN